ncbi:MAG: NAD(P)/FAD-dependent oxidoreductase, partial [bacterium]|nr:NAD(P)/FAD-dependent oxidoreductase [bacterium]
IVSANSVSVTNRLLETKNILIATGSRPAKPGFTPPGGMLLEVYDLLNQEDLPATVAVLGDGPHAVELAQFFNLIGKKVKLLVPGDRLLPEADPFLADYIKKNFKKAKIDILYFSKLGEAEKDKLLVDGTEIQCQRLVNASTRKAVIPPAKIELTLEQGFLSTNGFLQTNFDNIYAVGDVNGKSSLAHAASAQGLHAVNVISGVKKELKVEAIPLNMYTYPEIAQVGYTEQEIKEKGLAEDIKITEFPLTANGKALAEGQTEGLVRIISEKKYGEVLGVQI